MIGYNSNKIAPDTHRAQNAKLCILSSVFFVMQLKTKKDGAELSCIAKKMP